MSCAGMWAKVLLQHWIILRMRFTRCWKEYIKLYRYKCVYMCLYIYIYEFVYVNMCACKYIYIYSFFMKARNTPCLQLQGWTSDHLPHQVTFRRRRLPIWPPVLWSHGCGSHDFGHPMVLWFQRSMCYTIAIYVLILFGYVHSGHSYISHGYVNDANWVYVDFLCSGYFHTGSWWQAPSLWVPDC